MLPEIQKVNKIHKNIVQLCIRNVGQKQFGNLANNIMTKIKYTHSQIKLF